MTCLQCSNPLPARMPGRRGPVYCAACRAQRLKQQKRQHNALLSRQRKSERTRNARCKLTAAAAKHGPITAELVRERDEREGKKVAIV